MEGQAMIKQPALKRAGAIIVHDDPIVAALSEWLVDYALDRAAAETEAEIEERKNLYTIATFSKYSERCTAW
jgi:hypothetical protein